MMFHVILSNPTLPSLYASDNVREQDGVVPVSQSDGSASSVLAWL